MKGWKHLIYVSVAIGMLIYAVPRLAIGQGTSLENVFGVVWISFALLIIAANLHLVLGVDEEKKERLRQVKRMRRYQREEKLTRQTAKLG